MIITGKCISAPTQSKFFLASGVIHALTGRNHDLMQHTGAHSTNGHVLYRQQQQINHCPPLTHHVNEYPVLTVNDL